MIVMIASGGSFSPPRALNVMNSATATMTSAAHDHQCTLRRDRRSTSGAMIRMSPRMSSCMKGIETSLNVYESGTVTSTSAVQTPESAVDKKRFKRLFENMGKDCEAMEGFRGLEDFMNIWECLMKRGKRKAG